MLSVLIALLVLVVPSPTPSPSLPPLPLPPLPVIGHTVSSPLCNALHSYALPIGYVTRKNDEAFRAMSKSLQSYLSGIYPSDVPTAAELASATLADQANGLDQGSEDDDLLYGPKQTLTVAAIQDVANQIYANLVVEGKFMNQWWHDVPVHTDPQVDAVRQHLQNLMDLQRALADRYERFAGLYLDNRGMASLQNPQQRAQFKVFLRALLLGEVASLQDDPSQPQDDGFDSVSDRARLGNVAEVVRNLRDEEHQYAANILPTINTCDGTRYHLQTPHP